MHDGDEYVALVRLRRSTMTLLRWQTLANDRHFFVCHGKAKNIFILIRSKMENVYNSVLAFALILLLYTVERHIIIFSKD